MEKVKITNQDISQSIEFGPNFPYLLGEITGLSETDITPQTDTAYGIDGEIRRGASLAGTRYIKFDFWVNAATHAALHTARRTISQVLNFKAESELELTYTNDNGSYRLLGDVIYGPVAKPKKPEDRSLLKQHYEVGFAAYQPFWEGEEIVIHLSSYTALPIYNPGDVETPLILTFAGVSTGACMGTLNVNGIAKSIEVTKSLASGETLRINTDPRLLAVTYKDSSGNESSAFNLITVDSDFFTLPVLPEPDLFNVIMLTTTGGTPGLTVRYRYRYLGV